MTCLKPVMPAMAARAEQFLGSPVQHWGDVAEPLLDATIRQYEPLATRVDPALVGKLVEKPMTTREEISAEEFARIDLKVARVEAASLVEGADRLLQLTVDLGGEQRTVFSGIRSSYAPEQLVGRHVIVVANLKPRKLRFGVSQAMILVASDEGGDTVYLLSPDPGATAGMKVS